MDVLEDQHQRLRVGELGGPFARCPGDLLRASFALDRFEHADSEPEQIGHGLVAAPCAELGDRLLDRVVAAIPAATLTISASGQYVMPSP